MNTTIATLQTARQLLVSHGWVQGRARDGSKMCLMAATHAAGKHVVKLMEIRDVEMGKVFTHKADVALMQALGICYSLHKFNDAEGQTFDRILKAFDVAICNELEKSK